MYTVKILAALVLALLPPPLWVDARLAVCRLQIAALRRRKENLLKEKEAGAKEGTR